MFDHIRDFEMLILTCTLLSAVVLALVTVLPRPRRTFGMRGARFPEGAAQRAAGREPAAAVFARALLRNPRAVGACCPSSARLAHAVAAAVDPSAEGLVVELGGGTGAITAALLERGVPPERLVVLERDPSLARHLKQRFGALRVIFGDASELASLLAGLDGAAPVATIVSSLPMISLSKDEGRVIGAQICAVLDHGAALVQYTYQMGLPHDRLPRCLELVYSDRVWFNLPPARVEVYRHRD